MAPFSLSLFTRTSRSLPTLASLQPPKHTSFSQKCSAKNRLIHFFTKPSQGNENSGGSSHAEMLIRLRKMQFPTNRVKQTSAVAKVSSVSNEREFPFVETKGPDTPPEKLHARPVNLSVNGNSDSMPFEKLMQIFLVEDEPEVDGKGSMKQMGKGTVSSKPKLQPTFDEDIGLSKQRTPFRPPLKIGASNLCANI
ncbi:uncharacterized protein LOC18433903 [Amborella trichopoda]|nr:uncharacterized protein LOC18433903 [Amborella trichopoda]|eukprot:XP_020522651.1 uncharacterized protein LOC18433903 [Amborella trichopoda]